MESSPSSKLNLSALSARLGLTTAVTGLLMLASLSAHADRASLIAWGHKNDKKEQDSNSTLNSTSGTTYTVPLNSNNASISVPVSGANQSFTPGTGGATSAPPSFAPVPAAPPAVQAAPVLTAPTTLVDLSSGRFGKLTVDLQNAQFHDTSIDRGSVTATEMDFRQGSLKALNIDVLGGHFQQFIFDEMTLNTAGDLHFDPTVLLQEKVLQFTTPAKADVMVMVSQDSLNKFLADPHTLENLSVTVSKRLGGLASLFGAGVANIGVNLHEAHVVLNKGNKLVIAINADLGMGGVGVPLSFEVDAQLGVKDGWVDVSDTHLMTNGQEISPQLSEMLVKKINSLSSWGHKSDDIQFDFTEIKVVPGKQFSVKGTASIKRLRLTRSREEAAERQPAAPPGLPAITVPVPPVQTTPANNLPPQS